MAGLLPWLDTGVKIVDKLVDRIPDPAARERAKMEMESELLKAVVSESQAQTDVNKVEAAHPSIFVAGARPFIMWVCAVAFSLQFLLFPIVAWIGQFYGTVITLPEMDTESLNTVLFGMLGLGAMRTFEKVRGVARK